MTASKRMKRLASAIFLAAAGCTPNAGQGPAPAPTTVPAPATGTALVRGSVAVPGEVGKIFHVAAVGDNANGEEVPGAAALVYLTTPDGKLVSFAGQTRIATTVDASGSYSFSEALPAGLPLFAVAVLPGNQRLVGYTVTRSGDNVIDISLSTTYVTYFLARKARETGRALESYPLEALTDLTRQTRAILKAGTLPLPDLTIGADDEVSQSYASWIGAAPAGLRDGWRDLLGVSTVGARTVAIPPSFYDGMYGVAAGSGGEVFWSGHYRLFGQSGSGQPLSPLAGQIGDTPDVGRIAADGALHQDVKVPRLDAMAVDPAGNLVGAFLRGGHVGVFCRASGTYYGVPMEAGRFYRVAGTGKNAHSGTDGPARLADLREIQDIALDSGGNLFILERLAYAIRRVDRQTGTVSLVARTHLPYVQPSPGASASAAAVPRPETDQFPGEVGARDLAVRNLPDGNLELYFTDLDHNRIRRIRTDQATWSVDTVAGGDVRGFTGEEGPARDVAIHVSARTTGISGSAIDAQRGILYFFDSANARIRALDLASGRLRTVAGGGTRRSGGEATAMSLGTVGRLAVSPEGDLYFCDPDRNAGVRIYLGNP